MRKPAKNLIFVFGSNEAGIHGKGAAKHALQHWGAVYGSCYGRYGQSFAIPTKDEFVTNTLSLDIINCYITGFLAYAYGKRKLIFKVTRIGCGLAGYTDGDIAPLFVGAPLNCQFDEAWRPFLGDKYIYWGNHEEGTETNEP